MINRADLDILNSSPEWVEIPKEVTDSFSKSIDFHHWVKQERKIRNLERRLSHLIGMVLEKGLL